MYQTDIGNNNGGGSCCGDADEEYHGLWQQKHQTTTFCQGPNGKGKQVILAARLELRKKTFLHTSGGRTKHHVMTRKPSQLWHPPHLWTTCAGQTCLARMCLAHRKESLLLCCCQHKCGCRVPSKAPASTHPSMQDLMTQYTVKAKRLCHYYLLPQAKV